jgi:hypothetical protein
VCDCVTVCLCLADSRLGGSLAGDAVPGIGLEHLHTYTHTQAYMYNISLGMVLTQTYDPGDTATDTSTSRQARPASLHNTESKATQPRPTQARTSSVHRFQSPACRALAAPRMCSRMLSGGPEKAWVSRGGAWRGDEACTSRHGAAWEPGPGQRVAGGLAAGPTCVSYWCRSFRKLWEMTRFLSTRPSSVAMFGT